MMHWVIQENFAQETKYQELIDILEVMEIPYTIVKVVPFVGEIIPDIDGLENVIVIGSYSMRKVAQRKGWYPGSFDIEKFGYDYFVERLGDRMLNHDAVFMKFSELSTDFDDERFIRPVADSKAFAGGVYDAVGLMEFQESVASVYEQYSDSINNDTLCMMAETKAISAEYRVWVVDGKAAVASQYKIGRRVLYKGVHALEMPDLYAYANNVAALLYDDLQTYVVDICLIDGEYKIVEFNTMNAAGFYDCNIQQLAMIIHDRYSDNLAESIYAAEKRCIEVFGDDPTTLIDEVSDEVFASGDGDFIAHDGSK